MQNCNPIKVIYVPKALTVQTVIDTIAKLNNFLDSQDTTVAISFSYNLSDEMELVGHETERVSKILKTGENRSILCRTHSETEDNWYQFE